MASLRELMIGDMILAGFKPGTQRNYLRQVELLAGHYMTPPDQLTEQQVRDYFLYLREEKQVSRGSFQQARAAIRFLFYATLDRDWSLFSKKRSPCRCRNGCPTRDRTRRSGNCSARSACRSTAHACVRCTHAVCV